MEFQNTNLVTFVADALASESTSSTFQASASAKEVTAVSEGGAAVAADTTVGKVIVKDANGKVLVSNRIDLANATFSSVAYSAPADQVTYIGFNGTSGSIDEINNNLYQVNLEFSDWGSLSAENRYRKQGHYESGASASQEAVADGLVASLIRNFSREGISPELPSTVARRLRFERVTSDAGDTLGAAFGPAVFTQGSKVVSVADVGDATGGTAPSVGDYLRIGTAVTDPVYKVAAVDTTADTLTLDVAYQGASATIADTALELITAADAAAGNFGIKMTGIQEDFKLGKIKFTKIRFTTTLVDFGTTAVTNSVAATEGNGDGRRVAELEWFAKGNTGDHFRMGEPHLFEATLNAVTSSKYDTLTINLKHKQDAFVNTTSPSTLQIFCDAGAAGTDHTVINALIGVLDNSSLVTIPTL